MKTIIRLLTALLCVLLTPLASHAAFNPIPGHVYEIRNLYSGNALEVGGSDRYAVDHNINLWPYWGGANQQWVFERVGTTGNDYRIYNRNSRQYLQVYPFTPQQLVNDRVLYAVQSPARLVWTITERSSGGAVTISRKYQLPNQPTRTAFLLRTDAPGAIPSSGTTGYNTVALSPNEDEYFSKIEWAIVDRSAATPGVFRIMNVNSGKALSANEDNSVTQLPMWYLAGQEWTFSDYNADGYLSIINRNTNQVLEIGGGGWGQAGSRANVWDGYGHPWQQWQLVDLFGVTRSVQNIFNTGIPCKIVNRYSGLVLEIGGNVSELTQDGRAANQWYDWGGPNQQWNIYINSSYRGTATSAGNVASDPTSSVLTLYPNPASTTLQLTLPGNGEALQVTITDAQGRTVPVPHQHGKVDVSNLASGLYIVSAADGQKTFRQKFIKE